MKKVHCIDKQMALDLLHDASIDSGEYHINDSIWFGIAEKPYINYTWATTMFGLGLPKSEGGAHYFLEPAQYSKVLDALATLDNGLYTDYVY